MIYQPCNNCNSEIVSLDNSMCFCLCIKTFQRLYFSSLHWMPTCAGKYVSCEFIKKMIFCFVIFASYRIYWRINIHSLSDEGGLKFKLWLFPKLFTQGDHCLVSVGSISKWRNYINIGFLVYNSHHVNLC